MTEKEAVELIKKIYIDTYQSERRLALKMAISALFDKQEYRSIGTVEECREAVERQKEKKPNFWGDGVGENEEIIYDMYDCPHCGKSYEIDYEEYKHCPECGQAIDWRK